MAEKVKAFFRHSKSLNSVNKMCGRLKNYTLGYVKIRVSNKKNETKASHNQGLL